LSWGLTFAGIVVLVTVGWRRHQREGVFPFVQTGAAMVFWFLAVAKDNSPQYLLWVLPFVALLRLKPQIWVQLSLISVLMYLFFFDILVGRVLYVVGAWQTAVFVVAMVHAARAQVLSSRAGVGAGAHPGPADVALAAHLVPI
jgi:hypothetical protein